MLKLVLTCLLISSFAWSESCSQVTNALSVCNKYVHVLEDQSALQIKEISVLKQANSQLETQLTKVESSPLLPTWAWFLVGAGLGTWGTLLLKH